MQVSFIWPQELVNLDVLEDIIEKNNGLTEKMLHTRKIQWFKREEGYLYFVWEADIPPSNSDVYIAFMKQLCRYSKERFYTQAPDKVHNTENEKFYARQFLHRMGYMGSKYLTDRKILMQPLSGTTHPHYVKRNKK